MKFSRGATALFCVLGLVGPLFGQLPAPAVVFPHVSPVEGEYVVLVRAGSGGVVKELFRSIPLGKTLEAILDGQCKEVARRTGFDPQDMSIFALAGQGPNAPTPVAVGLGKEVDMDHISQTVQASGGLEGLAVTPGGDRLVIASDDYQWVIFRSGLFLAGSKAAVDAAVGTIGPDATPTPDLLLNLLALTEGSTGVSVSVPATPGVFAVLPGMVSSFIPLAVQADIRSLTASITSGSFTVTLEFATAESATSYVTQVPAIGRVLKGSTAAQIAQAGQGAGLGPFSPVDAGMITARLSESFFANLVPKLKVNQKGNNVFLSVPHDWLEPVMMLSLAPMAGSLLKIPGFAGLATGLGSPVPVASAAPKSEREQCRDIQGRIAGAISAYRQKGNLGPDLPISLDLLTNLVKLGYLDEVPEDPGQGPGSSANYFRVEEGNGVSCKVHGNLTGTILGSAPINPEANPAASPIPPVTAPVPASGSQNLIEPGAVTVPAPAQGVEPRSPDRTYDPLNR